MSTIDLQTISDIAVVFGRGPSKTCVTDGRQRLLRGGQSAMSMHDDERGASEMIVEIVPTLIWGGVNALIASKRGRSAGDIFALSVAPVIPFQYLMSVGFPGDLTMEATAYLLPPLIGLITVLVMPTGAEAAARTGAHGDFVRCPACAESVRKLATKCRHCGSDLPAAASDPVSAIT